MWETHQGDETHEKASRDTGDIVFLEPVVGGYMNFLLIIHYFVLLYFICFSVYLFYFTISKKTIRNISTKLFLRDPSSSPTFI